MQRDDAPRRIAPRRIAPGPVDPGPVDPSPIDPGPIDPAAPAEIYDARFVPALFGQWGPRVAELAGARPGAAFLDVACGTGALACAAARIVGPSGHASGLDPNPDMLAVARRKPEPVEWVEGAAEALPFPDARFDAVGSQFGMMFFEDAPQALREMLRVLRPGGGLAVAVCGDLDRSDGYAAFARLLRRLFGAEVEAAFRAPFSLGDPAALARIAAEAGIPGARIEAQEGAVRFASIADMVSTERACVWTLGGLLDDDQFARLTAAAEAELAPFADGDGMRFAMPANVLAMRKEA